MLRLSPFLFFPPSDEKERRNHSEPSKEKSQQAQGSSWNLKTKKDEDDLFPQIFSNLLANEGVLSS